MYNRTINQKNKKTQKAFEEREKRSSAGAIERKRWKMIGRSRGDVRKNRVTS